MAGAETRKQASQRGPERMVAGQEEGRRRGLGRAGPSHILGGGSAPGTGSGFCLFALAACRQQSETFDFPRAQTTVLKRALGSTGRAGPAHRIPPAPVTCRPDPGARGSQHQQAPLPSRPPGPCAASPARGARPALPLPGSEPPASPGKQSSSRTLFGLLFRVYC